MGLARKVDAWVGLGLCALLYLYGRGKAALGGPPLPRMHATTPPREGTAAPARPRRILAIKTYGLGNMVILLPALAALRRAYPEAEIDMLTLRTNRDFVERTGLVDRVIPFEMEGLRVVASLARILFETRRRGYDLVVDFEQFIKLSAIVAFLTGAPERIGFNTDGQRRGWLYTTRVVYTDSEHMSGIFARLLRPLGVLAAAGPFPVEIRPEEESGVDVLLAEAPADAPRAGPLVVVHVGSGPNFYDVPLKRWPIEHFAQLGDALVKRHDARIVFTGKGGEERDLVARSMALMKEPSLSACDRLSIGQLLALLRRADLVVSNDTSVMHLSAVVETPVVAIFGPTSHRQYGPIDPERHLVFYRDLFCSPCVTNYNLKVSYCADPICIRGIPVEQVLAGIERRYLSPPLTGSSPQSPQQSDA